MKKKRILLMTSLFLHGGIENYILNILDNIDRNRYEFDIAMPGMWKQQNEDALIERGIHVIHYPANGIGRQVKEINRILNAGDYDVVHVMQCYVTLEANAIFAMVSIAKRKQHHYKVICHAHGSEDTGRVPHPLKRMLRNVYRALLRANFRRADALVACSQEAGQFLFGGSTKVDILHNGIVLDRFIGKANDTSYDVYGIKRNWLNFAAVARMSEEKNPIFTLEIIRNLINYYPNLQLTWAGDGILMEEVKRYVEAHNLQNHINLLGNQNHVEEILSCCDYFLLPTQREGFGIVFIEAQAAGLQCFTSDRVPHVIDCGGVSFIALDKTAEQWADEIHALIESEPAVSINMDLLNRFDINKTVLALSEVYDRLVETE